MLEENKFETVTIKVSKSKKGSDKMKGKLLVAQCRMCKKVGETEPPITCEEIENSPIIIYCDECEDFTLADIIETEVENKA